MHSNDALVWGFVFRSSNCGLKIHRLQNDSTHFLASLFVTRSSCECSDKAAGSLSSHVMLYPPLRQTRAMISTRYLYRKRRVVSGSRSRTEILFVPLSSLHFTQHDGCRENHLHFSHTSPSSLEIICCAQGSM